MVTSLSGVSNINFTALNGNAFADSLSQNSSSAFSFKASTLDAPSAPISPALKNSSSLSLPKLSPVKSFVMPELSATPGTGINVVAAPSLPAVTGTPFSEALTVAQARGGLLDNLSGPYTENIDAFYAAFGAARSAREATGEQYVAFVLSKEVSTTWGETRTLYYTTGALKPFEGYADENASAAQAYLDAAYPQFGYKVSDVTFGYPEGGA